jgi:hypothetical protein
MDLMAASRQVLVITSLFKERNSEVDPVVIGRHLSVFKNTSARHHTLETPIFLLLLEIIPCEDLFYTLELQHPHHYEFDLSTSEQTTSTLSTPNLHLDLLRYPTHCLATGRFECRATGFIDNSWH